MGLQKMLIWHCFHYFRTGKNVAKAKQEILKPKTNVYCTFALGFKIVNFNWTTTHAPESQWRAANTTCGKWGAIHPIALYIARSTPGNCCRFFPYITKIEKKRKGSKPPWTRRCNKKTSNKMPFATCKKKVIFRQDCHRQLRTDFFTFIKCKPEFMVKGCAFCI